jgi:sterol desaturase/sphingolipid hydroxylase (fatty acid hydroxylase superfamily)
MSMIQSIQASLPGSAVAVLRLAIWLVLLGAIFIPLERFFSVHPGKPGNTDRLHDLLYYFLNSLLPALAISIPLSVIAVVAHHIIPSPLPVALSALPLPAKLAIAFIVGEIGFYWGHRLSHEIPFLWRFHAIHHSPEHLYFLVNTRAHPVDMIFTRLFGMLPLYLLGLAGPSAAGSITPVTIILLGTIWGFFIHSNLRVRLGLLEWLIATPAFHHWHHSRVQHINRNYASMLPILDKLFGTFHLPREWPTDYGLTIPLVSSFTNQLLDPFCSPVSDQESLPVAIPDVGNKR